MVCMRRSSVGLLQILSLLIRVQTMLNHSQYFLFKPMTISTSNDWDHDMLTQAALSVSTLIHSGKFAN